MSSRIPEFETARRKFLQFIHYCWRLEWSNTVIFGEFRNLTHTVAVDLAARARARSISLF